MTKATSEDTEITLGTGKLLALFFGLVTLCAVFFSLGFSFGKNSAYKLSATEVAPPVPNNAATLRPSAMKNASTPAPPEDTGTDAAKDTKPAVVDTSAPAPAAGTPPDPAVVPVNGYYVQVAAVSKQEDADALVDALKKKQYPAFSANTAPDKLFHVQVGPYADVKDAEAMRTKLVADGYNPILKK
jgi:DedD protein